MLQRQKAGQSRTAGAQRAAHLPEEKHDKALLLPIQDEPPRCHEVNQGYQGNQLCRNKSMHENIRKETELLTP